MKTPCTDRHNFDFNKFQFNCVNFKLDWKIFFSLIGIILNEENFLIILAFVFWLLCTFLHTPNETLWLTASIINVEIQSIEFIKFYYLFVLMSFAAFFIAVYLLSVVKWKTKRRRRRNNGSMCTLWFFFLFSWKLLNCIFMDENQLAKILFAGKTSRKGKIICLHREIMESDVFR